MADPVPVLWCQQCNKPFTKQSALKRHGYYCRSQTSAPAPRRRSCAACAQAKTACDHVLPRCSRCAQKGLTCQYPAKTASRRRAAAETPAVPTNNEPQQPVTNDAAITIPPATENISAFQGMTPVSDVPMLFDDVHWNFEDMPNLGDFTPSLPLSTLQSADGSVSSSVVSPSHISDSTLPPINESYQQQPIQLPPVQQQSPRSSIVSIPQVPSPNVRTMMQRPKPHPGAEKAANLIFYTLKSYPFMLRQNTLPPFIHPISVSFTGEDNTTESMTNCISLMHMMAAGVQGSRKLFWRNVRQECERICDQNQLLSKWELLGAMQALSVYVLIRLDEGETDHNNLDYLLERAVILIAIQLSHDDFDCPTHQVACTSKSDHTWEGWVYKESRRRLAVIYRLLNKLIFFSPAAMCDMPEEFVIAPLPAKRQLWEAANAQQWKTESRKEPGTTTAYALAVDGEIVKLDKKRLSCSDAWLPYLPPDEGAVAQHARSRKDRSASWWVEWASGMDGFGSLIMLAASMA